MDTKYLGFQFLDISTFKIQNIGLENNMFQKHFNSLVEKLYCIDSPKTIRISLLREKHLSNATFRVKQRNYYVNVKEKFIT